MEEQKQPEGQPANEESVQQPSDKQEPTGNQEKTGTEQNPPVIEKSDEQNYEFDGNWQDVEEKAPNSVKWLKGVRRYLTKETDKIAQDRQKIEKYNKLEADPELNEFIAWKQARRANPYEYNQPPATTQPAPAYDENVDPDVQRLLAEKEREYAQKINQIEQRVIQSDQRISRIDKANEIEAYAAAHPDFWKLHQLGLIKPQMEKYVDAGKGTINDAYNAAQDNYQKLVNQVKQDQKIRTDKKKNAVSAKPSGTGEPDSEFVDKIDDSLNHAIRLAQRGIHKNVKVRKKEN